MNSGGFQLTLSKAFRDNNLCMPDHLMVSVRKELLKCGLARVAVDRVVSAKLQVSVSVFAR